MFLPALLLSSLPALASPSPEPRAAEPHPAEAVGDEALAELAAGRPQAAVRRIRAALSRAPDEPSRQAILCLLGRAERRAGDEAAAVETLSRVPLEAACGRRAAFDRADALLALGREGEAAALYEQAGAASLGEGRDLAVAVRLSGLAQRLFDDPDASKEQAYELLAMALELELPLQEKVRRATELGARLLDAEVPQHRVEVAEVLIARLRSPEPLSPEEEADLRRLAARLHGGAIGERLLQPLPEDEATLRARAEIVLTLDPPRGIELLARAQALSSDPEVRAELAQALHDQGRLDEARSQWQALLSAPEPLAAKALLALALLELTQEPGSARAIEHLASWLERFPSGTDRLLVEGMLSRTRLSRARASQRVEDYDAFLRAHPADPALAEAAYEAGLAALRAGQEVDARQRWLALMASRPESGEATLAMQALALHQAFDQDQPAAAMAWLRELRDEGGELSWAATQELTRFEEPELAVLVDGIQDPRAPVVKVRARNLSEVQVRLHRIDPEAFLRAGGHPEGLPELDVAVISPDREWTATLPAAPAGKSQLVELPLRVPGPGIYAVTVASPGFEARAIALVSEARLLTRARGEDLVVGVLRGERPASGQRVLVSHQGTVSEARTGGDGLARLKVTEGSAVVLSDGPAGPALLSLDWASHQRSSDLVRVAVDLDRSSWLPGDRLGFRLVGRRDEAPLTGEWRLWIELDGVRMPEHRLRADARGLLAGELDLPMATGTARLMGRAPGEEGSRQLAQMALFGDTNAAREVSVLREAGDATVTVREPDGRPVVGAALRIEHGLGREDELVHTDATGRVKLEGPREGVDWLLGVQLAGGDQRGLERWADPRPEPLSLHLDQDRLEPEEGTTLRLEGARGPLRIGIFPVLERPESPEAPLAPWDPELWTGLEAHQSWFGEAPPIQQDDLQGEPRWLEVAREGSEAVELSLPPLPAGRFSIVAIPQQPGWSSVQTELRSAAEGPRLGALPPTLAAGSRLDLPITGPALVTAEGEGIEAAALVRADSRLTMDIPWQDLSLALVATDAAGEVHARTVPIRAELTVELKVEETASGWRLVTQVRDPSGDPVVAQVALSALDLRALRQHPARGAHIAQIQAQEATSGGGAVLGFFRNGSLAEAIASALMEESARADEERRAMAAADGLLSSGRMGQVMESETMVLGGLGTRGTGSGGGGGSGYGSGSGSFGAATAGGIGVQPIFALRQRVLWTVGETDAAGRLVVEMDRPPAATWLLRATAATARSVGSANVERDAHKAVFLVLPELAPGGAGDLARPQAVVVNGSEAPLSGTLRIGVRDEGVTLMAGEQRSIALGDLSPGQHLDLRLESLAGALLDRQRLSFPITSGDPDPQGPLLRVAIGPGGGFPLLQLALDEHPRAALDVGAAARAARAALSAAGALSGEPRARALSRAHQHLAFVRARAESAQTVLDRAELLALLVEASRQLPELAIPRGELDQAASRLEGGSPESGERVAQLWALALAGRPVDEARLARLVRDAASLDEEGRSWLARTLILLGRAEEAAGLVSGAGAHAGLARAALGQPAGPLPPLPPVERTDRAHWIQLAALQPQRGNGRPVLRVDGVVVPGLDAATGGELRLLIGPSSRVELDGAPLALIQRSRSAPGELPIATSRAPVGADGLALPTDRPQRQCGGIEDPCRIGLGESLQLAARIEAGTGVPGGLVLEGTVLRATHPGRFLVTGLSGWDNGAYAPAAPLHVEVLLTLDETPPQRAALELAEEALLADADPLAIISAWPGFDDWDAELRPRAMTLRFRAALRSGSEEELVAAFEAMRDGAPEADLSLADVARVARSYAAIKRPTRAITAWRAGLGAAFLAEAAPIRRIEDQVGRIVGLKVMRELVLRYPSLPVIDEAEFHLPERLASMIDEGIPSALQAEGITPTDIRLLAAAWDREFLALHPDSTHTAEAGLHLSQGLLRLRAWAAAAEWSDRVATASPEAPVLDALRYVEALARAELGQPAAARSMLERIAKGEWPQPDGSQGPASLAPDATYALARIAEARGDRKAAIALYEEVGAAFPEAGAALAALTQVALSAQPLVILDSSEDSAVPVRVANVETVYLRAYRLDLRTIFLRDGGLDGARDIEVSGVSPVWSGSQRLSPDPFPRTVDLDLPLSGDGAWLVQFDAGGERSSALLVRSALDLDAQDGALGRRLVVREAGQPAAGAEVRALDGSGGVIATRTDLRGVALVPYGAATLVFDGDQLAFTAASQSVPTSRRPQSSAPAAPEGDLLKNLDKRLMEQRQRNELDFEEQYAPAKDASLKANML